MWKLKSLTVNALLLFISFGSTPSYAVANHELEAIRSYFTISLMAASDEFECFTDNDVTQINKHLELSIGEESPDPSEMNSDELIAYDGAKLINRVMQLSHCDNVSSLLNRVDTTITPDEISDFDFKLLVRQVLLLMVETFTLEASMMNHLNYGDPDILSGAANNLFYELARDQLEFSLVLINVTDFEDIETKYLYKFFLERSDELLGTNSEDALVQQVSPSIGKIYQKMGLFLIDAESFEDSTDLFEPLLEFVVDINPHVYKVNKLVLDSLPQGI